MADKKEVAVDWFNIKSGEEIKTKRPAQIKALIESSDMGVNRQSDKGWRLGKEWVAKLRKGRQDKVLMGELLKLSGDGTVTDTQLLVTLFQRELEAAREAERYAEEAPFEQQYLESIKPKSSN